MLVCFSNLWNFEYREIQIEPSRWDLSPLLSASSAVTKTSSWHLVLYRDFQEREGRERERKITTIVRIIVICDLLTFLWLLTKATIV